MTEQVEYDIHEEMLDNILKALRKMDEGDE